MKNGSLLTVAATKAKEAAFSTPNFHPIGSPDAFFAGSATGVYDCARMKVSVDTLGPSHLTALKSLLTRDVAHNMYLLGLLEEFGVMSRPGPGTFAFWGRFADGNLTAALFVGGTGGLVVPSASPTEDVLDIARHLKGTVNLRSCLGERALVDALALHLAGPITFSKATTLYSVSADDLGPFTNPLLRLATEKDLPQLVDLAAGYIRESHHRDPLVEDAPGFRARVDQRIKAQRTYVLEEKGTLLLKLDVGARSQFGAELHGLYTLPSARKAGHATLCLGQISRFLMSSLPRLTVRVDDATPAFGKIARKVGYVAKRAQRLIFAAERPVHAELAPI